VLERGVAQKLPTRKMKSLFAKFLRFEEHHGTPEGVEKVRQMAVSYVETTAGHLQDDDN
jgi:rRNA biogenesis protein RRP5